MSLLASILSTTWLIVLVILFFNLMIFVHELGHFLAAKWRGAYVDRFQIWFGKPLWQKKIGGVQWGVGWIPAGGFVSLPQMADMEAIEGTADVPANLQPLKPLDKVIIAAAGPLFSLLLAYAFACVVWAAGKPVAEVPGTTIGFVQPGSPAAEAGLLPGDHITAIDGQPVSKWMGNMEGVTELIALGEQSDITFSIKRPQGEGYVPMTVKSGFRLPESKWWQRSGLRKVGIMPSLPALVGEIVPGSPAAKAGLQPGWEITAVNGQRIYSPVAITEQAAAAKPMELFLTKGEARMTATITPEVPTNWQGKEGARPVMGFNWGTPMGDISIEHPGPQEQVGQSLKWMGDTMEKLFAPGSSIGMEHLSGPVGIGNYLYNMMEAEAGIGWRLVFWFAVVLNVNLAVLNILPLPVVDGGHVVLGIAEMIRRKPVKGRLLDWVQTAFVLCLLSLFLFITLKDVGDLVPSGETSPELPSPIFSR